MVGGPRAKQGLSVLSIALWGGLEYFMEVWEYLNLF